MRVYEDLKYKKHYVGENKLLKNFCVGFFVNNEELDKEFHGQTYLFRENLKIDLEELKKLVAMSLAEQFEFVSHKMALNVFINDNKCAIKDVVIDNNGIQAVFVSEHDESDRDLSIEVVFNMPQLKGYSEFLVSINEPTYSPMIQLSYPESTMSVIMFPFLNDGAECLVQNAMRNAGSCDIYLQDKWLYPMIGVVFIVEDNKNAEGNKVQK